MGAPLKGGDRQGNGGGGRGTWGTENKNLNLNLNLMSMEKVDEAYGELEKHNY